MFMDEINLLVFIEVLPGKRAEQIEAYKALKPLVEAEPGCLRYELLADSNDENRFILIETWASQGLHRTALSGRRLFSALNAYGRSWSLSDLRRDVWMANIGWIGGVYARPGQ